MRNSPLWFVSLTVLFEPFYNSCLHILFSKHKYINVYSIAQIFEV